MVEDIIDSGRLKTQRTGRSRTQAATASIGWSETSSLPPKAAATGRGQDADAFERQAEHARDLVAVHIGSLGAGEDLDAVAAALRVAGFRLDIGMLDEAGAEGAGGDMRRLCKSGLDIAALDPAAGQHIIGGKIMQRIGVFGGRSLDSCQSGQGLPADRKLRHADGLDRFALADDRQHAFAAIPGFADGKHRLVLQMRIDAEGVLAGDIRCREDPHQSGMARHKTIEIAKGEAGARVRTAQRPQPERVIGRPVGAIELGAADLRFAIEARQTGADGGRGFGGGYRPGIQKQMRGPDRLDDLEVAGAAAQHAAQRIERLRLARLRLTAQQIIAGHQHAGRADAALGGAMRMESPLHRRAQPVLRQTFDRRDGLPGHLPDRDEAGASLFAIDQHRTGAAIAGVAAALGPGRTEAEAQHVAQPGIGAVGDADAPAVQGEGDVLARGGSR